MVKIKRGLMPSFLMGERGGLSDSYRSREERKKCVSISIIQTIKSFLHIKPDNKKHGAI